MLRAHGNQQNASIRRTAGTDQKRNSDRPDHEDPLLNNPKVETGETETRKQTPCKIYDYWNYRDKLSEEDGILLKQDKIIIPLSMRGNMLERIHKSHMGIEKSKRRARDIMFTNF